MAGDNRLHLFHQHSRMSEDPQGRPQKQMEGLSSLWVLSLVHYRHQCSQLRMPVFVLLRAVFLLLSPRVELSGMLRIAHRVHRDL